MIFGLKNGETLVPIKINRYLMCVGVLLYAGVGLVSLFLNGKYLDYNVLSSDPSSGQPFRNYTRRTRSGDYCCNSNDRSLSLIASFGDSND
jgi:hypothetical protein